MFKTRLIFSGYNNFFFDFDFSPFHPPVHSSHPAMSSDPRHWTSGLWRKLQTSSIRNRSASSQSRLPLNGLTIHPLGHSGVVLIARGVYTALPPWTLHLFDVICVYGVDALSSLGVSGARGGVSAGALPFGLYLSKMY